MKAMIHMAKRTGSHIMTILLVGVIMMGFLNEKRVNADECIKGMQFPGLKKGFQEIDADKYYRENMITNEELRQELSSTSGNVDRVRTNSIGAEDRWKHFLSRAQVGKNIIVEFRNGKQIQGKLKEADENGLVLQQGNQETRIQREDIVKIKKPRKLLKSTLIGMGIGLGTGLIIGKSMDCNNCEDNGLTTFIGGTFGPMIGGAGGLITGLVLSGTLYP